MLFEISATEQPGVFDVNAKFMGVNMEKVELVFQVCGATIHTIKTGKRECGKIYHINST